LEKLEDEKGMETILPTKNNLIQDSEGNEENVYPVQGSKKTKINDSKEPSNVHKNTLKEEILQEITRISWRCYWTCSTKTYKRHSRNSKTPKIKNTRRHRNK
jgi:hypothetical protein